MGMESKRKNRKIKIQFTFSSFLWRFESKLALSIFALALFLLEGMRPNSPSCRTLIAASIICRD